jgi:hypothetical protein
MREEYIFPFGTGSHAPRSAFRFGALAAFERFNMGSTLSQEITRFILTSIPSVPYLEAMLLLHRDDRLAWDSRMIARALYISDVKAEQLLADLKEAGITVVEDPVLPSFRFLPDPRLREQIDLLAAIYPRNIIEISNLIHSGSKNKAQQFANAFKLRKDT